MSIHDLGQKIKTVGSSDTGKDLYIAAIIILVAFGSFGLGRFSKEDTSSVVIEQGVLPLQNQALAAASSDRTVAVPTPTSTISATPKATTGAYVASSHGKRYYPTSCSAANNLSEANKIYFNTKEEAEAAGYTKSASCPDV